MGSGLAGENNDGFRAVCSDGCCSLECFDEACGAPTMRRMFCAVWLSRLCNCAWSSVCTDGAAAVLSTSSDRKWFLCLQPGCFLGVVPPDTVVVRESTGDRDHSNRNPFIERTLLAASQTDEFYNIFGINDSEDLLFSSYTSKLVEVQTGLDGYLGSFKEMMDVFQESRAAQAPKRVHVHQATQDKSKV
jgi:hypothetical protein